MITTQSPTNRDVHMKVLPAYERAFAFRGNYLVLYGGAGSGKSWMAAQKLVKRCIQTPGERFLVARKVARTLRHSCFKLLGDTLRRYELTRLVKVNQTDMHMAFPNGSEIIHAGLDDVEKLKSLADPTGIWIEEATEVSEEDFVQLDLRVRGRTPTYKQVMLSFNPISSMHWLKQRFVDDPLPGSLVIHTTHRDNPYAGPEYAQKLAGIRDERLRAVYERGEWGQITKGLIYTDWQAVDEAPEGDVIYGLDFGFNNPSALVRVTNRDQDVWVEELLYESNMTNADLIARLESFGIDRHAPVYCDAAEPQRIQEIHRAGYNAKPADKDVLKGIDSIKARGLHVVRGSQNVVNELNTYKWVEDKDGNILDRPVKWMDHALDAMRYAVHTHWGNRPKLWLIS